MRLFQVQCLLWNDHWNSQHLYLTWVLYIFSGCEESKTNFNNIKSRQTSDLVSTRAMLWKGLCEMEGTHVDCSMSHFQNDLYRWGEWTIHFDTVKPARHFWIQARYTIMRDLWAPGRFPDEESRESKFNKDSVYNKAKQVCNSQRQLRNCKNLYKVFV